MRNSVIFLSMMIFLVTAGGSVRAQSVARSGPDFDGLVQQIESLQRYRINLLSVRILLQRRAENLSNEIEREKEAGNVISNLFLPGKMESLHLLLNQIENLDCEIRETERMIRERYADTVSLLGDDPPREILDFLDLISGERLRRIRQSIGSTETQLKGLQGEQRERKRQEVEALRQEEQKALEAFVSYYNQ